MPIPKPNKGENEQAFISRCMGDKTMNSEYPDQKQRSAICYGSWRKKSMDVILGKYLKLKGKQAPFEGCVKLGNYYVSEEAINTAMAFLTTKSSGTLSEVSTPDKKIKATYPVTLSKAYIEKDGEIKRKYIEFTTTGSKLDRDEEMVSDGMVDKIMELHNSGTIPAFGNHGMDANGMRSYKWQDMIGKWVKAYRDPNEPKNLKSVLLLNEAHPESNLLWEYAKAGMPLGASIGGNVIEKDIIDVDME